jgi:hypothetical protein
MSFLFQGITAEPFVQVDSVYGKCTLLNKAYAFTKVFQGGVVYIKLECKELE